MSLYAQYVKEREGYDTIEDEYGFATFKIDGEECYIRDIFVVNGFREHGSAAKLADFIADHAKKVGCTHLLGSVYVDEQGTASLKVLLGYGFKLSHADGNMIYFKKGL
jgi:GNAT superfamily N-acetyltransferase